VFNLNPRQPTLILVVFLISIKIYAEPVIFTLHGRNISEVTDPNFPKEIVSYDQSKKLVESQLISKYKISVDSASLQSELSKYSTGVTTETVSKFNDLLSASASLADAFINKYGENNVNQSNVETFYNDNKSSPLVSALGKAKVFNALQAYGNSRLIVSDLKRHSANSVESIEQNLNKNISYNLQIKKIKSKLAKSQPVTDEEVALLERASKNSKNSVDDPKVSAGQIKEDYLYNLFIINSIKKDAVVVDKDLFSKHVKQWQKSMIDVWKPVFPTSKTPTENELSKP